MRTAYLSDFQPSMLGKDADALIDWLLENGYDSITENITQIYGVKYLLDDLYNVWEAIRTNETVMDYIYEGKGL